MNKHSNIKTGFLTNESMKSISKVFLQTILAFPHDIKKLQILNCKICVHEKLNF